ncbi:peptide deformylase [Candidatus Woesebacteria bacterium]|nr:peptide deformylase [Candidatus Woesebacteria bacterium]
MLLQVAQLGHPILRQKAESVKDINDPKVQELIDNLIATVMDVDGVGIAAPQVYQPWRLFILASHPNPRYPNAPEMEPTAIINPKIISTSPELIKDWEGCLSIPGIRSKVLRHKAITVTFFNRDGKRERKKFEDFIARIFQHEYDHLEGIVFLDKLVDMSETITEKEYQKLMKKEKEEKEKKVNSKKPAKQKTKSKNLKKQISAKA